MDRIVRLRLLAAGALSLLSIAAGAGAATVSAVSIDNFTFAAPEITVGVGTEVIWTNHDDIPHTVTDAGDPRAFKSGALDTDQSFSFRFSQAGTYHYFCSLHPHMQGTVVVR